jgi:hypothetical protein
VLSLLASMTSSVQIVWSSCSVSLVGPVTQSGRVGSVSLVGLSGQSGRSGYSV